ncbi:Fur family transcriptional regulator [Tahibacter sp. UC22_41]|uniref:Fur family transcriptional regulator n=1 Tax=Tahibacter sp. UC22_41 TaxID=3350178 RepID=UPI0036DE38B9
MTTPAKLLTNRKLRVTVARLSILELFGAHPNLSPKDVYRLLDRTDRTLSTATIHRVLAELRDAGLVERHYLKAGVASYSLRRTGSFAHLVCRRCQRIESGEDPALQAILVQLAESRGFALIESSVSVHGVCSDCSVRSRRKD